MKETQTLIVGASVAGLALAASLQKHGINYIIIEKQSEVASPWRNHYERLHLHTNKRVSNLPYKKFGKKIPRYPSRQQVTEYLEDYQRAFNIQPVFNTEAKSIRSENGYWITQTANEIFRSKYVIMATGAFSNPKPIDFKGMETFPHRIMHSCEYKTGEAFNGQKVLVIGFGNSACEIAIDLFEQGAIPSMSVRSAVNVVPRELGCIPIVEVSQFLSRLSPRVADAITAPLMKVVFGNITKYGLKKLPYGPFAQFKKSRTSPVLDIGVMKHIRKGHIKIFGGIDRIDGSTVHFTDGKKDDFDAIVACIGFDRSNAQIIAVDKTRYDDLNLCVDEQEYFGKDGLYFCGYWVGPTGQIREIANDAQKIAKDIARKERLPKASP